MNVQEARAINTPDLLVEPARFDPVALSYRQWQPCSDQQRLLENSVVLLVMEVCRNTEHFLFPSIEQIKIVTWLEIAFKD